MAAITLCRLEDIVDGGALGLPEHKQVNAAGLVAVRQGEDVRVYVNRCPHFSVSLDYRPSEFCTYRGKYLMCAHHSAVFRFEDGHCIDGPCKGAHLESVAVECVDGHVILQ